MSMTLGRLAHRRRELLTPATVAAAATTMWPRVEGAVRCSLVGFLIHPCGEGGIDIESIGDPFLVKDGNPSTSATPWNRFLLLLPDLATLKTEQ